MIPNFWTVFPPIPHKGGLYRGGQPDASGIASIAKMGVRVVLDLRDAEDAEEERRLVEDNGMLFESIPLPGLWAPKRGSIMAAITIIRFHLMLGRSVFVHCYHGEDRTGVVIACYQMTFHGLRPEFALSEAKFRGMSRWQFGMRRFIKRWQK